MARSKKTGRSKAAPKPQQQQEEHPVASSSSSVESQVHDLLAKSHTLLAQQDYELASQCLKHLIQLDPTQHEAREMLAVAELEQGNVESAYEHFTLLTQSPNPSSSAHLYLAQLSPTPEASLAHYEASMPLLSTQLSELESLKSELPLEMEGGEVASARSELEKGEEEVKGQMCRALVGMTEIYLTDLCMEPQAEDRCLLFLQKALSVVPQDPEAWLTLSSVRLSQSSPLEALACLSRAWNPWRSLPSGSLALPSTQTRLAVVRLMVELGLQKQALEVLAGVREEDDEDVEGAYLEGWVWYLRGSGELASVFKGDEKEFEGLEPREEEGPGGEMSQMECWEESRESLTVCALLHQAQSHPTLEILEHTKELLALLDQAGVRPAQGVVDDDDLAGEGGDALEWADEDEDDEMEM